MLIKAAVLATALTAPLLLSPVAAAEPDPAAPVVVDPAAVCAAPEVGGVLATAPPEADGVTRAQCQYIVSGRFYYDNYENGVYTGTLVYQDGARVPTERPVMPEILPDSIPVPVVPFPGQF